MKNKNLLPDDFDSNVYLLLNPDVKKANDDPVRHYLTHGIKENRLYKKADVELNPTKNSALDRFIDSLPTPQNVIDLFEGNWSSKFPDGFDLISKPGYADLFNDKRIE